MTTLGSMQAHYMAEKGIALDRSLHGFCYFFRKHPKHPRNAFRCDVRGPKVPWEGYQ